MASFAFPSAAVFWASASAEAAAAAFDAFLICSTSSSGSGAAVVTGVLVTSTVTDFSSTLSSVNPALAVIAETASLTAAKSASWLTPGEPFAVVVFSDERNVSCSRGAGRSPRPLITFAISARVSLRELLEQPSGPQAACAAPTMRARAMKRIMAVFVCICVWAKRKCVCVCRIEHGGSRRRERSFWGGQRDGTPSEKKHDTRSKQKGVKREHAG